MCVCSIQNAAPDRQNPENDILRAPGFGTLADMFADPLEEPEEEECSRRNPPKATAAGGTRRPGVSGRAIPGGKKGEA